MLAGRSLINLDSALKHGLPDGTNWNLLYCSCGACVCYVHTGRTITSRLNPYVTVAVSASQSNPQYRA